LQKPFTEKEKNLKKGEKIFTVELGKEILSHYWKKVPEILKLEKAGGTANCNIIITTDKGKFFLKRRSPRYSSQERVIFESSFQDYLYRNKLPVFPPCFTRDKKRCVNKNGQLYQLYPFVPGQRYQSLPEEVESVARHLALFHQLGRCFSPPVPKILPRYDDPAVAAAILQKIKNAANNRQKQRIEKLERKLEEILRVLPDFHYWKLPGTFIHGDWHPVNLLFRKNCVCGIFDFDWVSWQPRIRDLTDGLLFFCSRVKKRYRSFSIFSLTQPMTLDAKQVTLFLETYQKILPLTVAECKLLPVFMEARWIFCRVDGLRKVAENKQIDFLLDRVFLPLREIRKMSSSGFLQKI